MNEKFYFDYAATTPLDPDVFSAMEPYLKADYGNPSSIHYFGQRAENAVEKSREIVADYLHCHPTELIFTSCGTESNNLALRGTAMFRRSQDGLTRLLSSKVEHHAITHTIQQLSDYYGFTADWSSVDEFGVVNLNNFSKLLNEKTALVSFMLANNEIGSINPIQTIAEICLNKGVPFHTDAVQAAGYYPINLADLPVSLLSLGSHKFYGPKGVGALFIRKGTMLLPTQTGGGQEFGLRAGTQNVAYIVGFAAAIEKLKKFRETRALELSILRDELINRVLKTVPDSKLTGHPTNRLPNHASFVFKNVDGNLLLGMLDQAGFACSSGSACKTGNPEPSDVLIEIGLPREWALGSLRLTLGQGTSQDAINKLLDKLPALIKLNRELKG
ncbi:MAG TPA: cysteine desulfurase family protein [Anaerolineales bacterium]|nr:cysteine desulfurase family protein [Anaerolineales bacterium]